MVSLPGAGEVPLNVARICAWTWICAPAPLGPDNHPNVDGYAVIARAFAAELGY
jgi:lysophospholipase L1-like esterase